MPSTALDVLARICKEIREPSRVSGYFIKGPLPAEDNGPRVMGFGEMPVHNKLSKIAWDANPEEWADASWTMLLNFDPAADEGLKTERWMPRDLGAIRDCTPLDLLQYFRRFLEQALDRTLPDSGAEADLIARSIKPNILTGALMNCSRWNGLTDGAGIILLNAAWLDRLRMLLYFIDVPVQVQLWHNQPDEYTGRSDGIGLYCDLVHDAPERVFDELSNALNAQISLFNACRLVDMQTCIDMRIKSLDGLRRCCLRVLGFDWRNDDYFN